MEQRIVHTQLGLEDLIYLGEPGEGTEYNYVRQGMKKIAQELLAYFEANGHPEVNGTISLKLIDGALSLTERGIVPSYVAGALKKMGCIEHTGNRGVYKWVMVQK
jgi:hypothetical protein